MNDTQKKPVLNFERVKINENNPWEDDVLDRQGFARILTNSIKHAAPPLTISVNGKWGTGKTFLLCRWRQELETAGYRAIYFNAWTDDFCDNPLVAIIGKLFGKAKFPEKKEIWKITKNLAGKYALAKLGLTQQDLETYHEEILGSYANEKSELEVLREKLTDAVKQKNGKPVVFIVDELDRCRPTYAVELLERIKHVFNIPGMFFVLGMNRLELQKSVKHVYGDIDAEDYLRRFYEVEITLREPKSSQYCRHIMRETLFPLAHFNNRNRQDYASYGESMNRFYPFLFDYMGLSLRDTEHCLRLLYLILMNTRSEDKGNGWAITFLIVLRMKNPDLYFRFVKNRNIYKDVAEYMFAFISEYAAKAGYDTNIEFTESVIEEIIYSLAPREEREKIKEELQLRYQDRFPSGGKYLYILSRNKDHASTHRLDISVYSDKWLHKIAAVLDLSELP